MRKRLFTILAIILIISGLSCCLFPIISNTIGTQIAISKVEQFDEQVDNAVKDKTYQDAFDNGEVDEEAYPIDEDGDRTSDVPLVFAPDLDRLRKDSIAYNENLKENQSSLLVSDSSYAYPALDLSNYGIFDGIYGYVSAPSINMKLPIYLGANGATMSYGAAHMTYTSLPLGGKKTNTVLAGHTGYIGRVFFDNIRNLQINDEISLTNYWYTIKYRVIEKEIYAPNQSQAIFINDDRDLLTMITCISDGKGGFNRYYVICERI